MRDDQYKLIVGAARAAGAKFPTTPDWLRFKAAIDAAVEDAPPLPIPTQTTGRRIGARGLKLIQEFEGCKLEAYPDPGTGGKPWTIGWGSTKNERGEWFAPGDTITRAQADALLDRQLASYAAEVAAAIGDAPTTQAQFDALVSFHYNTGAIARATLTRKHIAGDYAAAAAEFGKWVNAGGKPMKGLIRRRAAEAALYRAGSK